MKREFPEHPIVAVGVVVINNGQVLLVRRGNEPNRGRWGLPGGVIELGETVRQAAEREVREETGVEVKAGEIIEVLDAITPNDNGRPRFHYVLIELLASYVRGDPVAQDDALDSQWFPISQLDQLDTPEITVVIIKEGLALHSRHCAQGSGVEKRAWQREFWS